MIGAQELLNETLQDLRNRKVSGTLRENPRFSDLCEFVGKHTISELKEKYREGTLEESVRKQYTEFCNMVWEIIS